MQQSLGRHIRDLAMDTTTIEQCYEPWSILRNTDDLTFFLESLQGLDALEFTICLKELESPSSYNPLSPIATFGTQIITKGDELLKSGIQATRNTVEKINESGMAASIQAKYDLGKLCERVVLTFGLAQLDRTFRKLKVEHSKQSNEL